MTDMKQEKGLANEQQNHVSLRIITRRPPQQGRTAAAAGCRLRWRSGSRRTSEPQKHRMEHTHHQLKHTTFLSHSSGGRSFGRHITLCGTYRDKLSVDKHDGQGWVAAFFDGLFVRLILRHGDVYGLVRDRSVVRYFLVPCSSFVSPTALSE